jgi:hypothetical protein
MLIRPKKDYLPVNFDNNLLHFERPTLENYGAKTSKLRKQY